MPLCRALFLGSVPEDQANRVMHVCEENDFSFEWIQSSELALERIQESFYDVVIGKLGSQDDHSDSYWSVLRDLKTKYPHCFSIVYSLTACHRPHIRQDLFDAGVNMVTADSSSLRKALEGIRMQKEDLNGIFACPMCGLDNLSEDQLWSHVPLYHANDTNPIDVVCPICERSSRTPFPVHLHNRHGPIGRGEARGDEQRDMVIFCFALVVIQHPDGRFLLTQEFANVGFWLPGGRVEAGEDFIEAARRETVEEAGVDVELTGILRVEWSPHAHRGYVRMRIIFYGRPLDESTLPKSLPDYESTGATWASLQDISRLRLRGPEPLEWCTYVAEGGYISPISMLNSEGAPPPKPDHL